QRTEVRLVSAVLQIAGNLGLLRLSSAAPHRVDPLAHLAGCYEATGRKSSSRGATVPARRSFPQMGAHVDTMESSRQPSRALAEGSGAVGAGERDRAGSTLGRGHLAGHPGGDLVAGQQ